MEELGLHCRACSGTCHKVSSPRAEIIVLAGFTMDKNALSAEASAAPYWSS